VVVAALLAPWAVTAVPADAGCGLLPRKSGITHRTKAFHARDVAVYGDSITFEAWRLLASRADVELAVDARSGRRTAPTVDVLRQDLRVHVPAVVVMAVGTNDLATGGRGVRAEVEHVRSLLPLTTRLLWVNTYVETRDTWREVNAQIATVPGVEIVDWATRNLQAKGTGARSPLLLFDKVHLSCAGGSAWASLIDAALRDVPLPVHVAVVPPRL
jgi:lysophospholipase L1-like esterase